jgi:ethanolamine utilization microcompartment shell protein EutS
VDIIADGAGALTVTASGATIKAAEVSTTSGSFTIGAQYSAATLLCVATDEYRLIGNITAV